MKTSTFNRSTYEASRGQREFYVEDVNIKVHLYNGSLELLDLTNAQKVGKACESYSIKWMEYDEIRGLETLRIWNFNLKALFNFLKGMPWEKSRWGGYDGIEFRMSENETVTIYKREEKAVRVYSPFALEQLKPLKEAPKKWTVRHAMRAIVNGQYEYLKCNGVYTDDYAYDNAYNYQQGEITNNLAFAQKILESPSGWWVDEREGVVSICCHSFDTNEFKFKA